MSVAFGMYKGGLGKEAQHTVAYESRLPEWLFELTLLSSLINPLARSPPCIICYLEAHMLKDLPDGFAED